MPQAMHHALGAIQPIIETLQDWSGYACFAVVLLPWVFLGLFLPSMLRRSWFERKQINSVLVRYTRIEKGCCPDCGYDLRGSPARCPECGHPVLWYQLVGETPKP